MAVRPVSRGGKWTFHGPGQIVIYPIVRLTDIGFSSRATLPFLSTLRTGVMGAIRASGITCNTGENPFGIYAESKKLVSFGIAISRGICSNGLAVYVGPQQNYFDGIIPCGVRETKVTSFEELGRKPDWERLTSQLVEHIKFSFKTVSETLSL